MSLLSKNHELEVCTQTIYIHSPTGARGTLYNTVTPRPELYRDLPGVCVYSD